MSLFLLPTFKAGLLRAGRFFLETGHEKNTYTRAPLVHAAVPAVPPAQTHPGVPASQNPPGTDRSLQGLRAARTHWSADTGFRPSIGS